MKLAREEERLRKRQKMEKETRAHERELQKETYAAKQQEILGNRQSQLEHLTSMKNSLGFSTDQLASYLLAHEQGPPAKLIQIQGTATRGDIPGSVIQLQEPP